MAEITRLEATQQCAQGDGTVAVVSIHQAINRVRCRQVVDTEGRGPSADIFIVLPRVETGDAFLEDIKADIPVLNVVDWKFDLDDGPRVRKDRKGDGTRGPHHPHGQPTDRRDTYLVHPTRTCAVRKLQDFATPSIGRQKLSGKSEWNMSCRALAGAPRASSRSTRGSKTNCRDTSIHKASGARSVC